jgi:membrane protease YdiL (CAAX protease family)
VPRPTAIVLAILVAFLVANAWLGRRRFARWLALREGNPAALDAFYLRLIVGTWVLGLSVPLTLLVSPELSPADIGLRWPEPTVVGYGLAAYTGAVLYWGARGRRRRLMSGRVDLPSHIRAILPVTTKQRWLVVGLSFTAGIVEEAVFRGLLIAGGVALGLSVYAAAALSLVLFAWGHVYQGRAGVIGALTFGFVFTALFLITGSLLFPIILHVAQDIVAFLLTPAVTSINIFERI